MTLKRMSSQSAIDLRDSIETALTTEVNRGFKSYLRTVNAPTQTAVRSASALVAAAADEFLTLGEQASMWAAAVDRDIVPAVRAALSRAFFRWTDIGLEADSPALEAANTYIAQVRDRLVRGTHMGVTVYEESFSKIRESLALSSAEGWSRSRLAEHIAVELGWAKDTPYWTQVRSDVDSQIDAILDPIGPPGSPARSMAQDHDPRVKALRTLRNEATKNLDAERSVWGTRAELISRTESTGAANYGAHSALTLEGVATKVWEATADNRTRPTHRDADGEEVGIAQKFVVGGALLTFPGDPLGPIQETAGCRCTIVGGGLD